MLSADELIAQLDPDQKQVALALTGPVKVLAGAGTGKTRAMTYRIAYGCASGVYDPKTVLALTFTTKAASELATRLQNLGVDSVRAATFHSAALAQLRYFWPTLVGGPLPELQPQKMPLVEEAAARLNFEISRDSARLVADEIEWAKVSLISPEEYLENFTQLHRPENPDLPPQLIYKMMLFYEQLKRQKWVIDFEDVLHLLAAGLKSRADVARFVQEKYKHFVVDEYQDVSALQQQLLDLWLGPRDNLCVVGDPAQTIYSFAGASSTYLTGFSERYPRALEIDLRRNYRSIPQVISLANEVMQDAPAAEHQHGVELISIQNPGLPVQMDAYADEVAEAENIAAKILHLRSQGYNYRNMAILYRANQQSSVFQAALTNLEIPYILWGEDDFYKRKEVVDAVNRLLAVRKSYNDMPLSKAVRVVLADAGWTQNAPNKLGTARQKWDSLRQLVVQADELEIKGYNFERYVLEIEMQMRTNDNSKLDGVTLASLHASKGLEWGVVFLVGLSEGYMPINAAIDGALDADQKMRALAEERRLLYVGITRAKEQLYCSYALSKSVQSQRRARSVTRFLADKWPAV